MHQPVHCESHSSRDRDRETTWRSLILSAVFCFCRCGAGLRQANVTARDRYIDECCHATTHDILRECIVVPHRRSGFPSSTLTRRIDGSATDEPHAGKPHSRRVTEKIIRPPTHRRETFPSNRFLSRYQNLNFVSGGFQHILFRCSLFPLAEISWDFQLSDRCAMISFISQDLLNLDIFFLLSLALINV